MILAAWHLDVALPSLMPAIVLRSRDRPSQLAVDVFVATVAQGILGMGRIFSTEAGPGVRPRHRGGLHPDRAQHRRGDPLRSPLGQSLRRAALIESVDQETSDLMDRLYEDGASTTPPSHSANR
jgi:hypothetical protein